MWQLNLLLLTQVVIGAGLMILLYKISKMKKRVDEITKEVKDYISYVIEDESENMDIDIKTEEEDVLVKKNMKKHLVNDEAKSSLIQSVLGEIFP